MSDAIYLIQADGTTMPAPNTPYAAEDDLQQLIARTPELLAGALITPGDPRRWLLVQREARIPDREGAAGYWALDHLLVDQDAVPTLVEVKRSSDSRIRREVVAQLLEYAANGTMYWDAAVVRAWYEAGEQAGGRDAASALSEFLAAGVADEAAVVADRFWAAFDGNLRAGRIRLLFVADAIPSQLRRLIEFLNQQMPNVEVLGVELPQYVGAGGSGLRAIVPRVIGQTEQAQARKTMATASAGERHQPWTIEEIVEQLTSADPGARGAAERVIAWARERGDLSFVGNRGTTWANVALVPTGRRRLVPVARLSGMPKYFLEIPIRDLMVTPPYDQPQERVRFHEVLAPITRMAKQDPMLEAFAYLEAETARRGEPLERVLTLLGTYIDRTASAQVSPDGGSEPASF